MHQASVGGGVCGIGLEKLPAVGGVHGAVARLCRGSAVAPPCLRLQFSSGLHLGSPLGGAGVHRHTEARLPPELLAE